MIDIIQQPTEKVTDGTIWWLIYNQVTSYIIIEPTNCQSVTTSPFVMVTSEIKQELLDYIKENNLRSILEDNVSYDIAIDETLIDDAHND